MRTLAALEIDSPPETDRFDIPAKRLVVRVSGLGRAGSADFRPVNLSGKCTTGDGKDMHFAEAHLGARGRLSAAAVVTGPDGNLKPEPPSPWA